MRGEERGVVGGELGDITRGAPGQILDGGVHLTGLATGVVGVVLDQSLELPRWQHVGQRLGERGLTAVWPT